MIVRKAKYKKVKVWQKQCVSQEVHGCDECKKVIDEYPNEDSRLEITVFRKDDSRSEYLHFCSWECVLSHIPKIKTDYFVNLPYLYFDRENESKRSGNHLIKLLKQMSQKHTTK